MNIKRLKFPTLKSYILFGFFKKLARCSLQETYLKGGKWKRKQLKNIYDAILSQKKVNDSINVRKKLRWKRKKAHGQGLI